MEQDLSKRFYFKSRERYVNYVSRKYFSDRQLEVQIVEQGIVLPARLNKGEYQGGVCDKNLNFVAGYASNNPKTFNGSRKVWVDVTSAYEVDKKEIICLDEDVIYGGALMGHFGHFITECLGRLWYILSHPQHTSI